MSGGSACNIAYRAAKHRSASAFLEVHRNVEHVVTLALACFIQCGGGNSRGERNHLDIRSVQVFGKLVAYRFCCSCGIAGVHLDEFTRLNGRSLDAACRARIAEDTRRAAYEIIRRKGATYYAIAAGLVRIIEAIVRDENSVLTVSGVVNSRHGLNDVAISLPSVVNRQGIANILTLPLSDDEEVGLKKSARAIHDAILSLNLDEQISIGKIPSVHLLLEQKEIV